MGLQILPRPSLKSPLKLFMKQIQIQHVLKFQFLHAGVLQAGAVEGAREAIMQMFARVALKQNKKKQLQGAAVPLVLTVMTGDVLDHPKWMNPVTMIMLISNKLQHQHVGRDVVENHQDEQQEELDVLS